MSGRGQKLSEAWYLDHANGNLSLGEEVFMASHIELSPEGARKVAAYEAIGGQILASQNAAPQDLESVGFDAEDIFSQDQADEEGGAGNTGLASNEARVPGHPYLPASLSRFVQGNALAIKWRFLGPKLRKCLLWQDKDGTKLWMLRAEGGTKIPVHSHTGSELTLVLKGSFHDEAQRFCRGDVQEADDDTEHDIIIDEGETCICLALTQAPLNFSNPLLRVFQLATGI
jgi:putative transcriptional regulator